MLLLLFVIIGVDLTAVVVQLLHSIPRHSEYAESQRDPPMQQNHFEICYVAASELD